jgi:hypothetical protein
MVPGSVRFAALLLTRSAIIVVAQFAAIEMIATVRCIVRIPPVLPTLTIPLSVRVKSSQPRNASEQKRRSV